MTMVLNCWLFLFISNRVICRDLFQVGRGGGQFIEKMPTRTRMPFRRVDMAARTVVCITRIVRIHIVE